MGTIAELRNRGGGRQPTAYFRPRPNPANDASGRSLMRANPDLQLLNNDQCDEMYDQFENIIDVKKEAFTPKADNRTSWVTIAVAVAIFALAILATITAAHGAGAIMAAAAGTSYLLGIGVIALGIYLKSKANDREREMLAIDEIHKAAARHYGAETMEKYSKIQQIENQTKGKKAQPAVAPRPMAPSAPVSWGDSLSEEARAALA